MIENPISDPMMYPPVGDPNHEVEALMAFRKPTRDWWMRVGNNRCQYEYYDQRRGWVTCGKRATQVHHIEPEGHQLDRGDDPEHSIGMPLCDGHHLRNFGDEPHSQDFSFHPDMAKAYRQYPEWKRQNEHMKGILGTNKKNLTPSPFEENVQEHRRLSQQGERYWAGTDEVDKYYMEKMSNMAFRYLAEHPNDPKPDTKPNINYQPEKKKKWWKL